MVWYFRMLYHVCFICQYTQWRIHGLNMEVLGYGRDDALSVKTVMSICKMKRPFIGRFCACVIFTTWLITDDKDQISYIWNIISAIYLAWFRISNTYCHQSSHYFTSGRLDIYFISLKYVSFFNKKLWFSMTAALYFLQVFQSTFVFHKTNKFHLEICML